MTTFDTIKSLLSGRQSRAMFDAVIDYVGGDQEKFDALIAFIQCEDDRMNQTSSAPINYIGEKYPYLLSAHHESLTRLMGDFNRHQAVRRNITRMYQSVDIPEEFHGVAIQNGFEILLNMSEPIANKAFAMAVLERITRGVPELREELALVIQSLYEHGSIGEKNRSKSIMKLLGKSSYLDEFH